MDYRALKGQKRGALKRTGRGILVALALGVAMGCSDDGASGPPASSGPSFTDDQLWGPPGTALPPGAELIDAEELKALSETDDFELVTSAGLEAAIEAEQAAQADARSYVDSAIDADPTLEYLRPVDPEPSDKLVPMGDGNFRLTVGDESFVVHGVDWSYRDIADSLRTTTARDNREADYRSLFEALPEDQRDELPDPADLADVDDEKLEESRAEAVHRAEAWLTNEVPGNYEATGGVNEVTGCEHFMYGVYESIQWPLKAFTTPIRSQGGRGTCGAFAITAALETNVFLRYGLPTDYGEQELYSFAKGSWFPNPNAYGDGIGIDSVLGKMGNDFLLDAERRWEYNYSWSRVEDDDEMKYSQSCDGYDSPFCSNTNHQRRVVCTSTSSGNVCGYQRPAGTVGAGYNPVRANGTVSLWNPSKPDDSVAAIRAHVKAGHPVIIGTTLDNAFREAAEQPSGSWEGVVDQVGYSPDGAHAMLVVGFIANGLINTVSGVPLGSGGGYLVLKNSWGCGPGDGGFMYVAYEWAAERFSSAHALLGVKTSADWPEAKLTSNKSVITEAGDSVTLRVGSRRAVRLEVYRGTELIYDDALSGATQNTEYEDTFEGEDRNGYNIYEVYATDQFGNRTRSNSVAVWVNIDQVKPQVTLTVDPTTLIAPGSISLKATASDNMGVAKVKFYRNFDLIAEDSTPPYSHTMFVGAGSAGDWQYWANAVDFAGNQKTSNVVPVTISAVPISMQNKPRIDLFQAIPAELPVGGGTTTLSWKVVGAKSMTISPDLGNVKALTGQQAFSLTKTTTFKITATNDAGTSTATFTVPVEVEQPDDPDPEDPVIAPTITSFTATPEPGGGATLSWEVEGTDPTLSINKGVGDVTGETEVTVMPSESTTYTLTATNSAGQATKKVTFTVVQASDTFVGPSGVDTDNDCFDEQMPCATLLHAAEQAGVDGVVWLLDGAYDATNQGATSVILPEGTRLFGQNPGAALLQVRLDMTGGEVHDLIVDRTGNTVAGLRFVVGGNVVLEGIAFRGAFPATTAPPLTLSGTTIATMTPGSVTNYAEDMLPTTNANAAPLIALSGAAELTINGGTLDSDAAGPGFASDAAASAILVGNTAKLRLVDFTLGVVSRGIRVTGTGTVDVNNSTIFARSIVSASNGYGVWISSPSAQDVAQIVIADSTLSGFTFLGTGGGTNAGVGVTNGAPSISLDNVVLTENAHGLFSSATAFPSVTATDLEVTDNSYGGVTSQGSMQFWGDGGLVSNNSTGTLTNVSPFYGGFSFNTVQSSQSYDVRLRNFQVIDNRAVQGVGNNASNAGIHMAGNAMSSFDLGTGEDPGGNTFTGNYTTPQAGAAGYTSNLYVATKVTVLAVGNTFDPNAQGADANGEYALGAGPCDAMSCDLTTGSGTTFKVVSGALRLAE